VSDRITVGYWGRRADDQELPWPEVVQDMHAPEVERALGILSVLENDTDRTNIVQYRGFSTCRLCGIRNGSREFEYIRDDGSLLCWPEGLKHYIAAHQVRLPKEITDLV
jgi:hypothetical protein